MERRLAAILVADVVGYYRGAIDGRAYGPQTRAALVVCLEAGCRVLE